MPSIFGYTSSHLTPRNSGTASEDGAINTNWVAISIILPFLVIALLGWFFYYYLPKNPIDWQRRMIYEPRRQRRRRRVVTNSTYSTTVASPRTTPSSLTSLGSITSVESHQYVGFTYNGFFSHPNDADDVFWTCRDCEEAPLRGSLAEMRQYEGQYEYRCQSCAAKARRRGRRIRKHAVDCAEEEAYLKAWRDHLAAQKDRYQDEHEEASEEEPKSLRVYTEPSRLRPAHLRNQRNS
ncbi:hypothetical protein B0H66DRAFT_558432 [Apodospora peruviana]|uniref:Uncharacterized protein n=1 Tax=Apodospora peruviana TaxID=516989 RepID=A0AAE0I7A4_9PEZI|nr:hypothetical protein B0H66DRAFT_558432 [Apodospora peruviana]